MLQLVLAAPRSGSGKTTAACALLAALTARGLTPCAFKSGPDYIDPMFHRAVLGVESHNLDLFFSAPQTARALYARHAAGHGAAVVEGAMGYYDGLGGVTDTASAWKLADTLDLPALLVVRPKGASLTLAAELRGLTAFRTPHHIAGILLNDCTQGLCALLKPMLEKETGLPVVGCLPPLPEAAIESRHLGLKTAAEIDDLQRKIQLLSDAAQQTIDWPLLHTLFDRPALCRARCPRRGCALPWQGTPRSALPTPKRWRHCGKTARSCAFSARWPTRLCRITSAGFTCRAATPSCTPPGWPRTPPCAPP